MSEDIKVAGIDSTRLRCIVANLKHVGRFHYEPGEDPHPLDCCLWGRVAQVVGVGSTTAMAMCRAAGEDPDYQEATHE